MAKDFHFLIRNGTSLPSQHTKGLGIWTCISLTHSLRLSFTGSRALSYIIHVEIWLPYCLAAAHADALEPLLYRIMQLLLGVPQSLRDDCTHWHVEQMLVITSSTKGSTITCYGAEAVPLIQGGVPSFNSWVRATSWLCHQMQNDLEMAPVSMTRANVCGISNWQRYQA